MNIDAFIETRVQHVLDIDIPAWQNGRGDWFTVKLLALIAKADTMNRERIRDAFPSEVEAFERWERSDNIEGDSGRPGSDRERREGEDMNTSEAQFKTEPESAKQSDTDAGTYLCGSCSEPAGKHTDDCWWERRKELDHTPLHHG